MVSARRGQFVAGLNSNPAPLRQSFLIREIRIHPWWTTFDTKAERWFLKHLNKSYVMGVPSDDPTGNTRLRQGANHGAGECAANPAKDTARSGWRQVCH